MMEEGASHLSWWSDVIALAASLVFAWPVVRTSFRLRKAEQTAAPPTQENAPRSDDVLSRIWSKTAEALREPLWSRTDHWATLIAFGLVIVATGLKVVSRFPG
jgi:hypothetical protein